MKKTLKLASYVCITALIAGCARNPADAKVDPLEGYNRVIYAFNQDIDHLIIRPAAIVYKTIIPPPLQKGVNNIFSNVGEITTVPNDILQGKLKYAASDFMRLVINTSLGIGGLFDVATRLGLPKHSESFGMTLAYWNGGKPSPYFILPIFGPNTMRSTFGLPFDYAASPWPYLRPHSIQWYAFGAKVISTRAKFLDADKIIGQSFDPYIFVRNGYLQNRNKAIAENMRNKEPLDAPPEARMVNGSLKPEPGNINPIGAVKPKSASLQTHKQAAKTG